ncbi:hypothetical protein [Streptomyces chiangmaiensis]|uniref:hypothetical protein n=1 Tax=Streptomyces chiangmaiensis TaxID=766497 RepID=UPI0038B67ED4
MLSEEGTGGRQAQGQESDIVRVRGDQEARKQFVAHDGQGFAGQGCGAPAPPRSGKPASAGRIAETLYDHVVPALRRSGYHDRVAEGLHRVLDGGMGADRQRAAARGGGLDALVDLVTERTAGPATDQDRRCGRPFPSRRSWRNPPADRTVFPQPPRRVNRRQGGTRHHNGTTARAQKVNLMTSLPSRSREDSLAGLSAVIMGGPRGLGLLLAERLLIRGCAARTAAAVLAQEYGSRCGTASSPQTEPISASRPPPRLRRSQGRVSRGVCR